MEEVVNVVLNSLIKLDNDTTNIMKTLRKNKRTIRRLKIQDVVLFALYLDLAKRIVKLEKEQEKK